MQDWCKTCGLGEYEHDSKPRSHAFKSSLKGIFIKEQPPVVDAPNVVGIAEARAKTGELRLSKKQELTYKAFELKDKGMSNRGMADMLGVSESTIRNIFAEAMPEISLEREIEQVLNKYSAENGSNTPDFILAEYLMGCLRAFNLATTRREEFQWGRTPEDTAKD